MARSVQEIYDDLISEKESLANLAELQPSADTFQTFLQDLTSTSKVAIWRLMFYLVAYGSWVVETLFDRHKAEIEALKFTLIAGKDPWYRERALEFQYGSTIEFNGSQYVYPVIDESQRIVKRASVITSGGIVRFKIAKLDTDGFTPIPLSPAELVSFMAYIDEIVFSGVNYIVLNSDADELRITYNVYYDPLVLTPTGESILNSGVFPVEDAINEYLTNLPFNGVLNLTQLTDSVQGASGVVDPVLQSAFARSGNNPFQQIVDNYTSFAGHMKIDPLTPLNTTINYIPNP